MIPTIFRTAELHDADEHARVHAVDQCLLEVDRQPASRGGPALHVLQLRPDSQDAPGPACDGGWAFGSRLEPGSGCGSSFLSPSAVRIWFSALRILWAVARMTALSASVLNTSFLLSASEH